MTFPLVGVAVEALVRPQPWSPSDLVDLLSHALVAAPTAWRDDHASITNHRGVA
jgi:hypothetical protein